MKFLMFKLLLRGYALIYFPDEQVCAFECVCVCVTVVLCVWLVEALWVNEAQSIQTWIQRSRAVGLIWHQSVVPITHPAIHL